MVKFQSHAWVAADASAGCSWRFCAHPLQAGCCLAQSHAQLNDTDNLMMPYFENQHHCLKLLVKVTAAISLNFFSEKDADTCRIP